MVFHVKTTFMILDCGRTDFNIFQCWDISEKLIFFFCFDDNGKNGFKLKKTAGVVWAYLVSILKIPNSLGQKERRFCAKHFVRCKEMTEMGSGLSSY